MKNEIMNRITNRLHYGPVIQWGLAGMLLACPVFLLAKLSQGFDYEIGNESKPILTMVALMLVAGVIYLYIVHKFQKKILDRHTLAWIILLGLLMRLSMFLSTPMLEDDHYRYLWDAGVLVQGYSPYAYSPKEVRDWHSKNIPQELQRLASESGPVVERINHPWLRTIYPPVSQLAFAFAHMLKPWSLNAWRSVLLLLDLATLILIYRILRRLKLPLNGLLIYWWNPLLVKEIYNSGHMDLLLFPFLLGALLLSFDRRYLLAAALMGFAFGVKFWPVILLPVLLRPVLLEPRRLVPALLIFVCICTASFLPFYYSGLDPSSGFTAYGRYWEMNDSLFMVILWGVEFLFNLLNLYAPEPQRAARIIVVFILAIWVFWLIRNDNRLPEETIHRFLLIVAAMFLLSPTQYPWYSIWMLPFLAVFPRFPLLLLTPLLSLYYLRFFLKARLLTEYHDYGIVWLEFVPVWYFLIWQWYRSKKVRVGESGETI